MTWKQPTPPETRPPTIDEIADAARRAYFTARFHLEAVRWDELEERQRELWREVARAAKAAVGGG